MEVDLTIINHNIFLYELFLALPNSLKLGQSTAFNMNEHRQGSGEKLIHVLELTIMVSFRDTLLDFQKNLMALERCWLAPRMIKAICLTTKIEAEDS